MMNWFVVVFNALWILGLSLLVAALSFANYLASQSSRRLFIQALDMPACRIMLDLGSVLFCLGWAGSVTGTWERIVWAVLTFIFGMRTWQGRKINNV